MNERKNIRANRNTQNFYVHCTLRVYTPARYFFLSNIQNTAKTNDMNATNAYKMYSGIQKFKHARIHTAAKKRVVAAPKLGEKNMKRRMRNKKKNTRIQTR